ncbi:MAG TPA: glycosyltransferase [Silvibacterium sp.]|nr:glycosyltransferase [Silvibacterium sp.]
MQILHVIPTLAPASGGPAEALRQLARAYAEIGIQAEIACQDRPDSPWIGSFAAPVHTFEGQRGVYGYSPPLRKWLAANVARYDGVVVHGVWTYAGLAGARAAHGRVPYAVFTHGMLDPWFRRRYRLKHMKKYLYWPVQYPVLRDARAVLFTTQLESELALRSFWPNKWIARIVPYGTNPPPRNVEAQKRAFQDALPQLGRRRFLLFLSRIHEKKGCDLLIEAFASVAPRHREVDLVIAGPDKDGLQARLAAMAQDFGIVERLHWPGMLTGDAKWGALRSCEAMILPSHQENFGVVVAEALACGRPTLISNQVNVWPQVEQDHTGLVEPDTLDGTRSLLARWFDLTDLEKTAMQERAVPSFQRRYSMQNCALSIRELFGG